MSRKSLDPASWAKWNTSKQRDPKEQKECTVWFWRYIPDPVIFAIGVLFLLPGMPLFIALIGGSEVVFFGIMRLVKLMPFLGKLPGLIWDFFARIGRPFFKDPRDGAYLLPMLLLTIWSPLNFGYALYRYYHYGFEWYWVFMYHAMRLTPRYRLFAYLNVMLHKEGHSYQKGLFKWDALNFGIVHFFIGLFYGAVPYSYPIAHNKIHHAYDNDLDDVHTNLDLDRSKFSSFIYYMPRFGLYWSGLTPAIKFYQKGQYEFCKKMLIGMLMYFSLWTTFGYFVGPAFTLAYVIYPFSEAVIFFGGISYLWHAWCDAKDINNPYVDSVTILNGMDNIYNEDYHVVHHTKPMAHWTEYPAIYKQNEKEYEKYNATIFKDCEEGEMLYWLFAGKWDDLAAHWVDLSGKMTFEDKRRLCLERLRTRLVQQ